MCLVTTTRPSPEHPKCPEQQGTLQEELTSSWLCVWEMKGEEANMLLRDAPFPYPRVPFSSSHHFSGWRDPRHLSGQRSQPS